MSPSSLIRGALGRLSPKRLLLLILSLTVAGALLAWLLRPTATNVQVWIQPHSLCRCDDVDGNSSLAAVVEVLNLSENNEWILGHSRSPQVFVSRLTNGRWLTNTSWTSGPGLVNPWTDLRAFETRLFLAWPSLEEDVLFKVGVAVRARKQIRAPVIGLTFDVGFAPDWLIPARTDIVWSPPTKLVKRDHHFFPVAAEQSSTELR